MDKQQAQKIIKETFENPFERERFIGFIKNLLKCIEEDRFPQRQGQFIPEAYRQYISTFERIGKFNYGENRIDILVIKLRKETFLERARAMQRNFVAGYLQGKYGSSNEKEAALVAFVSPDATDWRFSLVKMDYRFEDGKNGKVKVKEEFTPARRWSFLVGENEKSHTAQSRLVNILKDDEHNPTLEEIEKTFDIETVTKEFFLEYRGLLLQTKDELDKIVTQASSLRDEFEAKGVDTVNFAKKLLGQIVFLYFLQKKGWFGVRRDDDWGTGSKHFLRELFEKKVAQASSVTQASCLRSINTNHKQDACDTPNFFNDILEPLFYEALRIDRSHDDGYYSRFDCKIPFLNGGLFDPIGNYDWVHTDIIIPDRLFSNNVKTKAGDTGTGILDVFDRYNFTVKEDEPLEKEVAIDPELLGKAYEKFNAIRPDNYDEFKKALKSGKKGEENKFNKKFGVYYTPREIVHYMCQQSLINYLYNVTQASSLRSINTTHKQDACNTASTLNLSENIYFDAVEAVAKRRRNLPHWDQDGKAYFVTYRLYDSIPKEAAENIRRERQEWFERNKITDTSEVEKLSRENQIEYYRLFSKRYDELLDNGHGSCVLADSDCKKIVEDALGHFDNKRYHLDKYVVMPNHVHVIVIPMESWSLEKILHSWKSFTANAINKVLDRQGELWMHESFDHIIRSLDQLERIRKYIEDNPRVTQASSLSSTNTTRKQDACVTISKEDIETLIHIGEQVSENEATALLKEKLIAEGRQKTTSIESKLPDSIRNNATLIDQKLAEITVCDPAVGSGAFPVGMMSEIVKARNVLSLFVTQASSLSTIKPSHKQDACDTLRTAYDFKRHCIEHSLYGVDIDPGAVEIAKLRLWLSLVVDEDDIKNIKPLPNLDYRIMQGNSLISEFMGINFDSEGEEESGMLNFKDETDKLLERFQQKKDEFLNESNVSQKTKLKEEVDNLLVEIFETKLKRQKADYFNKLKYIENKHSNWATEKQRNEHIKQDKEKLYKETGFNLESAEKQLKEFTSGNKIKPFFLWNLYFSEVFLSDVKSASGGHKKGGFDVVIANPPYLRIQEIQKNTSELAEKLKDCYSSASGSYDIYACFVELVIRLMHDKGNIAYILPHKFFQASFGKNLRKLISSQKLLRKIVDFGSSQVFETATTYTCLLFLSSQNDIFKFAELRPNTKVEDLNEVFESINNNDDLHSEKVDIAIISNTTVTEKEWHFSAGSSGNILSKLKQQPRTLADVCEKIFQGIATSADKIYFLEHISEKDGVITAFSKSLDREISIEKAFVKPLLKGADVHRYSKLQPKIWSIFPYDLKNNKAFLYTQKDIKKRFPLAWKYLLENKKSLENRERGRMKNDQFYAYIYPKNLTEFEKTKITTPDIASNCQMTIDDEGLYHTTTVYSFVFKETPKETLKYFLALLNSQLLWYFLTLTGSVLRGGFFRFKTNYLMPFPIPRELSQSEQKPFITIVEQILTAKKHAPEGLNQGKDPNADTSVLERQIDEMVYKLYGLTEEEIKIVEGE